MKEERAGVSVVYGTGLGKKDEGLKIRPLFFVSTARTVKSEPCLKNNTFWLWDTKINYFFKKISYLCVPKPESVVFKTWFTFYSPGGA